MSGSAFIRQRNIAGSLTSWQLNCGPTGLLTAATLVRLGQDWKCPTHWKETWHQNIYMERKLMDVGTVTLNKQIQQIQPQSATQSATWTIG